MSPLIDVEAPANAEGTKATLLKWCKKAGEFIAKDEPLLEIETDKVTVEVPSPGSGVLEEILKAEASELAPGEILARLRPQEEVAAIPQSATIKAMPSDQITTRTREQLSPAVRRMFSTYGLTSAQIKGTGRNGRITVQDISRELKNRETAPEGRAGASGTTPSAPLTGSSAPLNLGTARRIPHSPMRRRIAEHMRMSMTVAPHVTTVFEADLTRVMAHRAHFAPEFKRSGVPLTMTAYFVAAMVAALRAVPVVNSTYLEDALEMHGDFNIGVATALGNEGLIVPVLKQAQNMSLLGIARRLNELVSAARSANLTPEDVRGGTFTISNHGVTGSILAAPIIINQPQVAILGIGKAERRMVIDSVDGEDVFKVRTQCYVTLTIDHRALDAFQANAFLSRFVSTLEQWELPKTD